MFIIQEYRVVDSLRRRIREHLKGLIGQFKLNRIVDFDCTIQYYLRDGLQIAILSFTQGSLDNRIGRPVDDHRENNQHQQPKAEQTTANAPTATHWSDISV